MSELHADAGMAAAGAMSGGHSSEDSSDDQAVNEQLRRWRARAEVIVAACEQRLEQR